MSMVVRRGVLVVVWGFVAATLGPGLGGLWGFADPLAKRLLIRQLVILGLLRIAPLRRLVPESILEPPAVVVPAVSVVALVGSAVCSQRGRPALAKAVLHHLVTWGGIPVINESIGQMLEDVGDADHPALISMALGLLLNEPVAAVVILIMLTGGEALEDYAMSRAESGIHELLEQEPGTARRILADGSMEEVQATDLAVGDSVMLRTGDTTPVDCEVSESANTTPREGEDGAPGSFEVDESMLTGEALPQKKVVGDTVHAGSINISSHPLRTIVLKAHADSAMTMFKATLAAALEKKAKLERSSIQMAADFTPFTLALASAAYWYQRVRLPGSTPLVLWGRVLAVTMAATPCPAAIGVPIAFLCGMSISSKHGIAMKSGAALENLGKSTVCVLDKTGTVTYGKPRVRSINFVGKPALKQDEALRLCASLEQTSNHPLAVAMITRAREKQLQMRRMDEVAVTEAKAGHGVAGEVDGWAVRIGTSEYVFGEEDALKQDEVLRLASVDVRPVAQLFAYFRIEGFGGVTRGWVACEDEVRPGAKEMVATFQSRGLRCVMLSGDRNAGTLEHIARHLGIAEFHTCLPHEKAGKVEALIAAGETVMMVGDGINDAPALATASVGVSIGVSDLASDSADVVLLATAEPIGKLVELITLGKKVHGVAKNGVVGGMAISTLQMVAAACGLISPRTSAVCQEVVDLGSLVHSLQLLFRKVL